MFRKICIGIVTFAFLQIPFFMMQYQHHLEGHLQELTLYRNQLIAQAERHTLTLPTYVLHFTESPDKIVKGQGGLMEEMLARFDAFVTALADLRESPPWNKPFVFLRHFDRGVISETASSFQIGFSITLEGFCYMGVGLIVGLLIFRRRRLKNGNV